jgi:hypothetical protein
MDTDGNAVKQVLSILAITGALLTRWASLTIAGVEVDKLYQKGTGGKPFLE